MSEQPSVLTEPLDPERHDRTGFSLDPAYNSLEVYLRRQATQDQRRRACLVYIWADTAGHQSPYPVVGYYTLSSASIPESSIPPLAGRLRPAPYPEVSAILIGRLAIDRLYQGAGNGRRLVADAFGRCLAAANRIGCWAVVVDPIDESAGTFYGRFGFQALVGTDEKRLFLPIATIERLLTVNP